MSEVNIIPKLKGFKRVDPSELKKGSLFRYTKSDTTQECGRKSVFAEMVEKGDRWKLKGYRSSFSWTFTPTSDNKYYVKAKA